MPSILQQYRLRVEPDQNCVAFPRFVNRDFDRDRLVHSLLMKMYHLVMFKRILVANRGEIVCRIIKSARRMGIATVAA